MIQRYGTQVSPNGDTLVYHEHGSWVKYTDHAAAIQELREALVGLCGAAYAAMAGRQNRPLSPFYAKARATLDKYKGED